MKCKENCILDSNKISNIQVPVVVETLVEILVETLVETKIMAETGTVEIVVEIAKSTANKVHAQLAMVEDL